MTIETYVKEPEEPEPEEEENPNEPYTPRWNPFVAIISAFDDVTIFFEDFLDVVLYDLVWLLLVIFPIVSIVALIVWCCGFWTVIQTYIDRNILPSSFTNKSHLGGQSQQQTLLHLDSVVVGKGGKPHESP